MEETLPRRRCSQRPVSASPHCSDFCFGRKLGEGSYARVVYCTSRHDPSQVYAMKIMDKVHIKKENKIKNVMLERQLLTELSSPYIIKLVLSFHDMENLYICMEFAAGGDLLQYIERHFNHKGADESKDRDSAHDGTAGSGSGSGSRIEGGRGRESIEEKERMSIWSAATKFYACEVVEALEHIHSRGIIHRDLKPENILFTLNGHIKLGDFGSALLVRDRILSTQDVSPKGDGEGEGHNRFDETSRHSFMGSSEYVSPEVLRDQEATQASDYWAFGCIIYKMLLGFSPFAGGSEYLTFQKILAHADTDDDELVGKSSSTLHYPSSLHPCESNVIGSLLRGPSNARLGTGGVKKIFKGFLRESNRDTGHRQGQGQREGQGHGQGQREGQGQGQGEGCEKKNINLDVEQQQQQHKQQQHEEEEDEILPHREAAAFVQHPHDQCCSSSSSSSKDDGNDNTNNDNNTNTTNNDECSSAGDGVCAGEGVGVGGIHSFKQHCFFKDVPWGRLLDRPVPANFSAPLGPLNQSSSSEVECYENFSTNLY